MPEILIICTANICRSPVVEALLRERLQAHGLVDWKVSSAGTLALPGFGPAEDSAAVLLAECGMDISEHRSRRAEELHLAAADLVLCMEWGHKESLQIESPQHRHKIFVLPEMVGELHEVADPIGGPREWYQQMLEDVTELIDSGLGRIIQLTRDHAAARPAAPTSVPPPNVTRIR